jgi:hypothetical protein
VFACMIVFNYKCYEQICNGINVADRHSKLSNISTLGRGGGEEKTPWSESASELYRPSDRRLSAK